jgi:hypothetical protein
MSGFLESQRLLMSSSWITGREAGTPLPAEIFVYPIFVRALARSLQLSYGEELRQPQCMRFYAPLAPGGYV